MERFVKEVLGGGLALVGGTWLLSLTPTRSGAWFLGTLAVLGGLVGLAVGIRRELLV